MTIKDKKLEVVNKVHDIIKSHGLRHEWLMQDYYEFINDDNEDMLEFNIHNDTNSLLFYIAFEPETEVFEIHCAEPKIFKVESPEIFRTVYTELSNYAVLINNGQSTDDNEQMFMFVQVRDYKGGELSIRENLSFDNICNKLIEMHALNKDQSIDDYEIIIDEDCDEYAGGGGDVYEIYTIENNKFVNADYSEIYNEIHKKLKNG